MKKFNRQRAVRFRALVESGLTYTEVGAREVPPITGAAVSFAVRRLERAADVPPGKEPWEGDYAALARAHRRKYDAGKSCAQIGREQTPPVTENAVRQLMITYGLWTRRPVAEVSQAARDRAVRFWADIQEGKAPREIGAAENPPIGDDAVYSVLSKAGYSIRAHKQLSARPPRKGGAARRDHGHD